MFNSVERTKKNKKSEEKKEQRRRHHETWGPPKRSTESPFVTQSSPPKLRDREGREKKNTALVELAWTFYIKRARFIIPAACCHRRCFSCPPRSPRNGGPGAVFGMASETFEPSNFRFIIHHLLFLVVPSRSRSPPALVLLEGSITLSSAL